MMVSVSWCCNNKYHHITSYYYIILTSNTLRSSASMTFPAKICTEGLNQNGARIHVSLRQDVDELRLFGWSGHGFSNLNAVIFDFDSFTYCFKYEMIWCHLRKFRGQTSDNMDRLKSRDGKSQRREKKKEDQRRERVRRKKMQVCEKVEVSRNTLFFQWFGAPESRKGGSLKRRVRSHLGRWEMKNCTPLWCEADFEIKMVKTPHVRTTLGCSIVILCGTRKGFCTLPAVSKTWGFCRTFKNDGTRGTFEEDLHRSTGDIFIKDVGWCWKGLHFGASDRQVC